MSKNAKTKASKTVSDSDYAKIGLLLVESIEKGLLNKRQVYKTAFIKGVLSGLGGVLGATVVVALLLWILTLLSEVSIIGPLIESLKNSVSDPIQ